MWRWRQSGSNPSPISCLLNREKYREFCRNPRSGSNFGLQLTGEFNNFQPNSLHDGTGNFQSCIREFFSGNRNFGICHPASNTWPVPLCRRPPGDAPLPATKNLQRPSKQYGLGSRPRRAKTRHAPRICALFLGSSAGQQCRLMLPGWYGFGTAIKAWLGARPRDGMKMLREMYREWPFFQTLPYGRQCRIERAIMR
jgi:phosphoenolpyruvate carboxylase-like protein